MQTGPVGGFFIREHDRFDQGQNLALERGVHPYPLETGEDRRKFIAAVEWQANLFNGRELQSGLDLKTMAHSERGGRRLLGQTAEPPQPFKMIANIRRVTASESSMPAGAIFVERRSLDRIFLIPAAGKAAALDRAGVKLFSAVAPSRVGVTDRQLGAAADGCDVGRGAVPGEIAWPEFQPQHLRVQVETNYSLAPCRAENCQRGRRLVAFRYRHSRLASARLLYCRYLPRHLVAANGEKATASISTSNSGRQTSAWR